MEGFFYFDSKIFADFLEQVGQHDGVGFACIVDGTDGFNVGHKFFNQLNLTQDRTHVSHAGDVLSGSMRLFTSPAATGSVTPVKSTGISLIFWATACEDGVVMVRTRSGFSPLIWLAI